MPFDRARVIALLDAFRAAEQAGADALERWIIGCNDARLRGGLRVIRARDRRHAALAEARLRALGGVPAAHVSRELTAICGVVADPGVSDRSKLAVLLARLPVGGEVPLAAAMREVEADHETRALLQTIGDEEAASLRWLREMHDAFERESA